MFATHAPPQPGWRSPLRASVGLVAALVATSALAACTGDDKKETGGDPPSAPPASAPVQVTVTKVAGTLRMPARTALSQDVAAVLQEYVDEAFLGDFPRADFANAFSTFTPGAAKVADKEAELITGAAYSEAESAGAETLTADLSVLAPRGKPAGVTATVRFVFDYDDDSVTYAGRLLLTPQKGTWRIFGYDLTRDDQATGASQ